MAYKSKFMQQLEQQGKLSAVSEQTTGETASASATTENYKSSFMKKLQSRGQLKETDGSTATAVTPAPMRSPTDRSYTDDTQSLSTTTASTGADSAYKTEVSGIKVQEAENKLAELSAKMEEVRQQEAALLENRKKLATAKQGLAQLNAQYNASGDETTAQAYLLATEEYQKLREETQKTSDAYEKNTSVYTDYEKANLDYQKAYADYKQQEQEYQQYLDDHPEEKYKGAQLQTLEQVLENLKAEKTALIQTGEAVDWEAVDKVNGKIDTVEGMIKTKKQNSDTSLWGSSGKDFFSSIMSGIQAGQLDWFAGMEQVDRKVGNAALGLAADWLSGVAKITKNENLLQTATQWKEQSHSESEGAKEALAGSQQAMNEALAGAGKIDGWIIQQMQSIGSMMMDSWMMGTTELYNPGTQNLQVGKTLSGGTTQPSGTLGSNGKLKQTANKVWNALDPSDGLSSLKIMAMRAGGTAMLQAQEEGKSETEQILIGIANGALEYVSEKMFGGSPAYDVDKGWVTKAVEKVTQNPTILRLLYSDGFDIFGEGIEEVFTGITEPIAEGLITGDEIEITAEDLINSFAGGVFLSLVGQGSNIVVREVSGAGHKQRSAERKAGQIVTNAEAVQDLVNKGLAAAPESEAYRKAEKLQKKLDKNKTISNREVGQQLFANQEAIEAGQLVDDTEVAQNENAPEGALHDPEDGVYAIGVLTDKTGKKETTMYQLLQITENGSVRTIGDPVNGLLAAKLGAESRGANVRYVGSIYEIREAMLTQAEEARSATEAAEAGNDGETGENGTEAEAAGQEWAGEQNAKDEAQNPSVSEADSSAQGTPYGRPDLSGEPLGEQVTTETAEETVPDLQWAGNTEAQTDRGENAANLDTTEAEASGIQWAGNEYEEVTNNEAKQQKQRDVGARTDQQGQRGREAGRSERGTKQSRAKAAMGRAQEASKIRSNAAASVGSWIELKQLGVREATKECVVTDLVEDAWTDRVREAAKIAEDADLIFTPVVGVMEIETASGPTQVTGVIDLEKGEIFVQADSNKMYVDEITRHEVFHELVNRDQKLVEQLRAYILETYSEEQIDALFDKYAETYREIYQDKVSEEELTDLIYEELFADAYAGYQRYQKADATELTEKVREVVQERAGQRNRQQNRTYEKRYAYAGTKSKTANLKALQQAQEMQKQNVAAETIFKETGWYVGADGKWRYEIDDSNAEFRKDGDARLVQEKGYQRLMELTQKWADSFAVGEELTETEQAEMEMLQEEYEDRVWEDKYMLTDFLKHDELFEAYPRLKGVSLIFDELPDGTKGFFSKRSNTIVLNNELFGKEVNVLLHEIQHVLQRYEEFAVGASPKYWNDRMEQGFSKKGNHGFEMMPRELYYNTAGEIEARDVAERRTMTSEERRNRMPNTGDENTVFADGYFAMSIEEQHSIREQLRENQKRLNEMEVVGRVNSQEYVGLDTRSAREKLVEEMKKTGYKVDRKGFGEIQFEEKEINNSLNYNEKNAAAENARRMGFLVLKNVLKRGIEIDGHDKHKGRNYDTVTIAAPVEINGERGNMAVVVKQTKGNRYKVHRILTPGGETFMLPDTANAEVNTVGAVTNGSQSLGGSAPAINSASNDSITNYGETVNRYSVASEDKAQQRAERELAKGIGEIMSMPNQAVRQIQTGLVRDIIEEYRQTGDLNMEKLEDAAATAFAQGLQIDNEFYERYKDLKTKLRTTAVTIAQQDQANIADYTQFKKRAFGTLRIVNQGGTPVDTLYQELVETAPELFSADITQPADQLVRMYEVAREIKRVETPLERALGEQSDRFYEWAEKKITALADRVLTKYADSVSWDQKKETQRGRTGQRTETDSAGTGALTQDELERRRSGEQNSQYVAPRGSNLRGGQREMGNWQEEQPEFKPAESGIEWAGQEQMTDWQQQYPEYEFQGYDPSEQFEQDMVDDFRPEEVEERTQEERQTIQQWIDYVMGTKDGWKEFAAGVRKDLQNRKAFSNETKERIMQRELPPGVEPPAPEDAEVVRRAMERAEKAREEASTASETADAMIIPKKAFTSTPAMEKLGIKIDGSVTRYRSTEMLRAYDRAAQKTQRMLNRRMSKLNATRQEIALAKGLVRGEVTVEMLNQNTVDLDKVTELADYMGAMEGFNNDRLSQRRAEINVTNLKIAQELLKDSDAYAPRLKGKLGDFTKIVMNERTPERVVKQIFGEEQGGKIYETYFRPVWVNGTEMNRFENRMLQRVAEFTDQNGLKRQLTEDERAMAQRLLEGEAVRMRMDELEKQDPDSRQRIENAATNVNNGMDWVDAANDQNLQEEELRGLVQAYADYMDTVSISQDMDQTILQNAIREYQTIYNEMYEAMNDFLVSHGYNEIGFIKGYAPHFQKAEVQNGLFGALKNLGVENTKVSALPTEIAGRTADFKPNMKWNPHMQSRKGSSTDYDILKGYEQYLHYAAEMFYHTDDVMRVRQAVNFMRSQFAADEITQAIEDAGIDSYKNAAWKREFLTRKEKLNPMGDYSDAEINAAYQKYVDELFEKAKPDNLKKYSEFTSWMDNYANILAGKQSYADRGTEYSMDRKALNIGRKVMKAFSEVNVAGNLSTVLNQSAQLPLIQTELGLYLERAAISMIRGDMAKENFADRSDFLTDKRGVDKLTTDNYEKVISALFKPAEMMDRMVSTLAVRGKYLQVYDQLKAKGIEGEAAIEQAMREADDFGRRVMGSRMKGAKPVAFESKQFISQMIHVFQVESSNTLDYMLYSEMPQAVKETYQKKGKAAAARYATAVAMKYLTGAFIMNLLTDTLYGGSPAPFDIMGWALNFVAGGWRMDDEEFLKTIIDNGWEKLFGSRIFGTEQLDREEGFQWAGSMDDLAYNIMGDVPYLRNVMGVLGWGDQSLPTVGINEAWNSLVDAGQTLWQQATEPEETGLDWAGAAGRVGQDLFDVATEFIPGGRQLQKTATGISAMVRGGKYSGYGENSRLQYPVEQNVWNSIRAGLFGLSALPESNAYYAGGTALTAAQTSKAQALEEQGVDIQQTYDLYQEFADINKQLNKERITSIEARAMKRDAIDDMDLTDEQKLEVYLETMAANSDTAREKYQALLDTGVSWQQLTQLDNDYASFNVDSDEDGVDDMTSLEKGIAKRNAINDMDLTDAQKLEVYDWYHMDQDSDNYEATRAEFEAMLNEGLTWDEITQAHNMYATLNADEELNATQKATQYAKWADEQDWNTDQIAAVKERYTFWQMIPAEASTYEKFTGAGLGTDSAEEVTNILAALEPEGDKENVTTSQKVLAIYNSKLTDGEKTSAIAALASERKERFVEAGVSENTSESLAAQIAVAEAENGEDELNYLEKARIVVDTADNDQAMAALSAVLNESTYAKVEIAGYYGVKAGEWVTFREEWLDMYGEDSMSQEKVQNVLDRMNLSTEAKAALWQISNKSWKPKNNPYSTGVGQWIYGELNTEE